MEVINSARLFKENYEALEKESIPSVKKEIVKRYLANYGEPNYLFRGAVIGLFFCLPFWAILFWLIT